VLRKVFRLNLKKRKPQKKLRTGIDQESRKELAGKDWRLFVHQALRNEKYARIRKLV
jgi:hypothetical protein